MTTGGILLAGGAGTRLLPSTSYLNKHLIPIYDKPMIYYSLSILLLSGIKQITVVCNVNETEEFKKLLGNGEEFGVEIKYSTQESPEGIPHGISKALEINNFDKFITVLGDNFVFGEKFFTRLETIFNNSENCSIFSQTVKNPENFGVIKINESNEIDSIVEKPDIFVSNKAIIGIYIFNSNFQNIFSNIKKSKRGEFEITDIIKEYNFENVDHVEIGRGTAWFDMGTTEDFYSTGSFVRTIQERQGLLVCSPMKLHLETIGLRKRVEKLY